MDWIIRSRRSVAVTLVAFVAIVLAVSTVRGAWAAPEDDGAAQLSQQVGRTLARLGDLEGYGPLAQALPLSEVLPGEGLGFGNPFDDDAPDAVGAAEGACFDGADDDSDGVADDGCGDDPSVESLADRFLNDDGTGKLTTFDDIFDELQVDESIAGLDIEVSEPTAAGTPDNGDGIDFLQDPTSKDIDFAIELTLSGELDAPLDLPTSIIDLVAVGGDGVFSVPVSLTSVPLHFHYDHSLAFDDAADVPAETAAESLWLQTNPAAAITGGSIAAPGFTLAIGDGENDAISALDDVLNLGFAGVDVAGNVALELLWGLSLVDPDSLNGGTSDFKILADEVVNTDLAELVSVAAQAPPGGSAVDATFTVDTDLVPGTPDLTIAYQAPTLADVGSTAPTFSPDPGTAAFKLLDSLHSFTPTDALGAVDRLVGMLGGIQSAGFLNLDLPFIEGGTCANGQDDDGDTKIDDGCVGSPEPANGAPETGATGTIDDVVALGGALGAAVMDTTNGLTLPPDPATLASGVPSFANARELAAKLDSGLGTHLKDVSGDDISVALDNSDPALPKLVYSLTLQDQATRNVALRFGNLDILDAIVLSAGGEASLQAGYEIPLTFALDLRPEPVEDGAGLGSCADGVDNGAGTPDGADGLDGLGTPATDDDDCASSRTLEQRVSFFVGEAAGDVEEVHATAGLQATNLDATARVGFLEVGITDGTLVLGPKTGAEDCGDPGDLASAECLASFTIDLVDAGDGWLTIEELFDALGNTEAPDYQADWSRTVVHDAGLHATLPVSATVDGTAIGDPADLTLTAGSDGLLETSEDTAGFQSSKLLDSLDIDTEDLHLSEIFNFSACGNDRDDDGDGVADDGCEGEAEAVEAPETESIALFDTLLDAIRLIADQFDASQLPAEFGDELPFVGKSYEDVFSMADSLVELADAAALGAESFLGAGACTNGEDDDGDGFTNDGCPQSGEFSESGAQCIGTANDDGTNESTHATEPVAVVNDGCDAVAPTVQTIDSMIEKLLEKALEAGLDTSLGDGLVDVTTTYDDDADDLDLSVAIDPFEVERSFPFVAGLPADLPDIVSLNAGGAIDVTVGGEALLHFGIGLDDLAPYVLGDSQLKLSMEAALGESSTFEAGVGPLTLAVGKPTVAAESGSACDPGDTVDNDNDGFANDGCGADGDAEAGADCSYGDVDNADGDDLVNDGCPARADSARAFIGGQLHLVETHDDDEKVALGDVNLGGGLAGGDVVGGVPQEACVDLAVPGAGAGSAKHACAVLPLYLQDTPIGAADTTEHHVKLAVPDLSAPTDIKSEYLGADDLETVIGDAMLDLLLFESGIGPLVQKILTFVNDTLLSVDLPVIGDALDQVVALANGLTDLQSAVTSAISGDEFAGLNPATSNASELQAIVQDTVATNLGQALVDAGILLDPDVADRVPSTDPEDVQAVVLCDGEPCDIGAEDDAANLAAAPPHDTNADNADNCVAANDHDDDGDGLANDGCAPQPRAEADGECANGDDDDNDGTADDGCAAVPQEGATAESLCDGVDNGEPDDEDAVVDDGCAGAAVVPAGDDSAADGSETGTQCDSGNTADDDNDGFVNDGCEALFDSAADVTDVAFRFRIGQAAGASTGPISEGFAAGVPGLGLGLEIENADLQAKVGWDLDLGLGVSKDHGFYFVVDENDLFGTGADADGFGPELRADAVVLVSDPSADPATLTGTLAFLQATAEDCAPSLDPDADPSAPPSPSQALGVSIAAGCSFLAIGATADFEDPATTPDGRLALSELTSGPSFSDLIDFTFTGRAELHLGLRVGIDEDVAEGMPELRTGIHLTWGWAVTAGEDPSDLEPSGDDLKIWMDGLYLDAGSFVSNFLAPVFEDVQQFTKAFQPIIEVLNEPIPVLSDFAGEPVTMRTLGQELAAAYDIDLTLLDMVIDLVDFVNSIKTFDGTGDSDPSLLIPLTDDPTEALDLNSTRLRQGSLAESQALQAFDTGQLGEMVSDLQGAVEGKVGGEGSASSNESSGGALTISNLDSVGISFPFLEHPDRLAGLLFGKHVTLVQWEPPPLVLKFCYSQKFGPIWQVPPVFIEFGGCVTLTGRFGIGYNTKGFQRALFDPDGDVSGLLQGLFLIDRHPLEGGSDSNELEFRGEIFANAQVSVLIFSAGAQGTLYLEIGIDLEDPNNDGITEFGEAASIVRTTGSVLCLFNLNGKLGLEFSVFAEVDLFFWSQRWTKVLADIVLFEFKIKCEPLDEPELARASGSDLYLNLGDDAKYRDQDDAGPNDSMGFDVVDEKWVVTRTGTGVKVRALGFTQDYPGNWSKVIVTNAAGGDDEVSFLDGQLGGEVGDQCTDSDDDDGDGAVNDGCDAQAHTDNPTLPVPENAPSNPTGGGTAAACEGASDDDADTFVNDGCPIVGTIVLIPFDIPVDVTLGDGNDTSTGGAAGGKLAGGGNDDVLLARGSTKYTITGGEGADSITGSYGDDDIDAGGGDDSVDAGPGKDKVIGGTGGDTLDGGRTAKSDPAAGPVVVSADLVDTIWGDVENEDSGTDHGADTIDGGDDGDDLHGGGGADRINGGHGDDDIFGGDETDDGCGSGVDDSVIGGPGRDDVDAQAGDDIVVGGNTLAGEPDVGDEELTGGSGCDIVLGDNALFESDTDPRAFQLIDAGIGGGEELIKGGTGNDIVRGQRGNDVIYGDTDEAANSGDGVDQVWGDEGNDIVRGGGAADVLYGDGGPSHPQFPAGSDELAGGGGGDTIRGEGGTDTIFGDRGRLDAGVPSFVALAVSGGSDNILGGSENDRIYGQEAGDVINGDGGADEVHGDTDTTPSGNDGRDDIRGGSGNDRLFGNDAADTMYGDAGDDLMAGGSQTAGNADAGSVGGFQDRMFGGSGLDTITGDNADLATVTLLDESSIGEADLLYGQLDDDRMFGENGNDLLFGGAGDDHMEGGDNTDTAFGETGQDDIIGGTTEAADGAAGEGEQPDDGDFLYGQDDADVIIGDNGEILRLTDVWPGGAEQRDVTLYDLDTKNGAYSGPDLIEGGMSTDEGYGGGDADRVFGFVDGNAGIGQDTIDHLEGNDGGDSLYGDADQDDLIGGTSAPADENVDPTVIFELDGGAHPDDGTDVLHGGDGTTALTGDHDVAMGDNATIERVLASASAYRFDDIDADAPAPRASTVDVLRRRIVLHDVATTAFTPSSPVGTPQGDDELYGESGWDELYAQGGDDLVRGGKQDDHGEGGDGEDELYGDEGQDDLIGGTGRTVNDDPATAMDGRLDDADAIWGGDGAGGVAADDFDVEMGDNATVLRGEPGQAWAYNTFNASVRRAVYQYDVGLAGDPAEAGTAGADVMRGEKDDDLMYGQGLGDDMQGGDGDDHMQGNEGADAMLGQAGNDDMVGGTGRINTDPVEGTEGRLDTGETLMRGGTGFDWMAGDNAIVERVLVGGNWVPDPNGGFKRHVLRMPDLFDEAAPFGGSRDEAVVSGADLMYGDEDHDVMYGGGNSSLADDVIGDVLHGGTGQDRIEGNEGGDEIHGNAGEDDLVGGTGKVLGHDTYTHAEYLALDATPGDPDLDLSASTDAELNLGTRGRHDGDDLMTGENDSSDGLVDGSDSDVMLGDNGIVLRPVNGSGTWINRPANDSTTRTIWFPDIEAIDLPVVLAIAHGDDDMWGNDNDDEMWGQGGSDLMFGGSGDDRMQGNHGADEMHGGPEEDDMLGGTGRVNDDPAAGKAGRLDMDDVMYGDAEDDVMTGDNAIIDRPLASNLWVTKTYKGYPDSTHRSIHVAAKKASQNQAPVAVGNFSRTDRVLTMMDKAPNAPGGSQATAGSDLMSGGTGDDDLVGQFDDTAGGTVVRTKDDGNPATYGDLTTLCDTPDESTLFGTAPTVTTAGDIVCGNTGEDAILGDQGTIVNRPETSNRQRLLVPNTPFSRDWIFINNTLSRLVTLDQFLEGGNDVLLGGDKHDAIHGGAGGDLINGDDGDDFIFGDDSGEIDKPGTKLEGIWGGRGHDTTFGGWGDDFIDVQPRMNIANFPNDPADWLFFAPPADENGFFRGFASIDHHYGGWDQDALQADLGDNGPVHGDRLMDWVGAYNVYYLCPSTYGAWVSLRDQPPDALLHMEDLAEGMGAVGVKTPGSSGFREAGIVYKPDVKSNQNPPHPDTPGHFVCQGINFADPTAT